MKIQAKENLLTDLRKLRAVMKRDDRFDGTFVFAVRSTGIYCNPSCPARRPRPEQVMLFSSPDDAEHSGFHPCKRCRPREIHSSRQKEVVERVCRYIEANLGKKLTLSSMSSHVGISPYYLQRIFKRIMGMSPREYVEAHRLAKMKMRLKKGEPVIKALYSAGFSSRSRLSDRVPAQFGMSPGTYRRGGQGMRITYTTVSCPLGRMLIATTDLGICAVCFGDSDAEVESSLSAEYPAAKIQRNDTIFKEQITAFTRYFTGHQLDLNLPLDVQATAFQWRVWKKIQSIPHGSTSFYGKIAHALGLPHAARAVARACATNPVPLIIPCHRVVRQDGKMGGYRWGVKRKQALLSQEQAVHQRVDSHA